MSDKRLAAIEQRLAELEAAVARVVARQDRAGFLHTWSEIAKALKRKPSTVRAWQKYGFPAFKRGGHMISHSDAIVAWLTEIEERRLTGQMPGFQRRSTRDARSALAASRR